MEKKLRKNIKKEFRKIVKNITGENSGENSSPSDEHYAIPKPPELIVETRTVEVQSEIPQCTSENQTTSQAPDAAASTLPSVQNGVPEENDNSNSEADNELESKTVPNNYESDIENSPRDQSIVYDPLEDLSANFHSILEKEYFSDVTIKCGTDVLKAHKIVLCSRSPVFEAMFTSDMQESEDGVVVIEDIEPHVLRDFLSFVYSGQLKDQTVSGACDLLYAAEKYQIRTLKQLCVNYLRSNLSVENAFQILECANLYDLQLRSYTLEYISEQFSVIEKTEDWKTVQLKSPLLALEVYSTVVKALQGNN